MSRPILGWRQTAALPELEVAGLPAKLDTGARGTALHATGVEVEGDRVRFTLHTADGPPRACETQLAAQRRVTSSNGGAELRPFIRTALTLGALPPRTVELSLTARVGMAFPLLVGRLALSAWEILVDPDEALRPWLR
jgi:hypothetical protein